MEKMVWTLLWSRAEVHICVAHNAKRLAIIHQKTTAVSNNNNNNNNNNENAIKEKRT